MILIIRLISQCAKIATGSKFLAAQENLSHFEENFPVCVLYIKLAVGLFLSVFVLSWHYCNPAADLMDYSTDA